MSFQSTNYQNETNNMGSLPRFGSNQSLSENTYLSKRILELGTGLIPLINNSEKCSCEKTCADFCLNRLNHQECNRSICGLSDHLHDVYCNNRPFLRFKNQKTKKYFVECFRLPIIKECKHLNSEKLKDGNSNHTKRVILSDNVSKGELIIECLGEILTDSDVRDRYQKYFKLKNQGDENVMNYSFKKTASVPGKLFCLVENFIYLDMTQTGNEAKYIRHSCNPNSQAEVWISRPNSHIQKTRLRNEYTLSWLKMGIFALKDIEKGTEITIDYENLMSRCTPDLARKSENPIRFLGLLECNCNFENCRKNIGTRKIHEAIEFSEFLIPVTNKKRRKDLNLISRGLIEQGSFSYNKSSLDSFLFLREKIIEDQKTWKEQHIKNKSNKTTQRTLNIFEIDKGLITQVQNSGLNDICLNGQFKYSSSRLPLWHLFSSLCWQGYHNHQECCNKHILHNSWWDKFKKMSENKNKLFNINFLKLERPRRSCSSNFGTSIERNKKYFRPYPLNQIRQKGIFLHIMSHPWLLALNNLTNIDIELGKCWKILLARSIDLGRWTVIQRLSFFFNKFKVIDEDLTWPMIDQGLGDDEKCTVCSSHGTLLSCDICSKSIHKSCLKKCNQFIASSSFCLPKWFSSNKINKESYFKELLGYYCQKEKSIRVNDISPYKKNSKTKKITVIYNPKHSTDTLNTDLKNENIQSSLFICHKCSNSVHTNFWLTLRSKEKRIISRNAMKIRFTRAYHANFYLSSDKKVFQDHNEKGSKANKKQSNIKSSQKYNVLRSARLTISHLFIWRQRNSVFKMSKELKIFSELSRNFKSKKTLDARWDKLNHFSNFSNINYTIADHDQSSANFSPDDLNVSNGLSISVQNNCQIVNSISIEEFINSLKK
ncbi:SET domain flanked by cysteine clusters plus a C-terminal PHD domain [Cryptosporidium sp. chipmunk genotype I]|uniref:SET domain flanked by cysteine clusters plus a C-terminal PHD domain n=1 Tax=Cryptosporidium sp. chipmunk genotype I TaxID=1280935 RepID=UPI00351AA0BC|nr:SET domain flanked by cysteine clusters plus a C-terminal PHD domain [Cryptosporidium sp. chipmunk genotype I]